MAIQSLSSYCTFNPPSLQALVYAVTVHGLCCIAGAAPLGILLYWIPSNLRRVTGILVGVVAALSIQFLQHHIERYSPHEDVTWLGPFLASTFGFSTFFKSINVAFSQFPEGADNNIKTWLLWFVILPEPEFRKGNIRKASLMDVWNSVKSFFYTVIGLFLLLSVLLQSPVYNLQLSSFPVPEWFSSFTNGFLHIWLIYLFTSFCLTFSILANIVTTGGMRSEPGHLNPLVESRCLREAWGERWNLPVQTLLKRTVYIPARKQGYGPNASAILTFLVSGVLHEYNFSIHNRSAYQLGRATLFFLIMGLLMLVESKVWTWFPRTIQEMFRKIPTVVISFALTFLVGGLFDPFFFQSWTDSGFVVAISKMIPHLDCR